MFRALGPGSWCSPEKRRCEITRSWNLCVKWCSSVAPTAIPDSERQESQTGQQQGQGAGSVYVHHATVGAGVNSAAVTLGLIHSLEKLCGGGVGYFRPIDSTSHGGHRTKLVQEVYHLPGDVTRMMGVTQEEAYRYIAQEKEDDLVDVIMKAYEEYKATVDFVVVEGTSLRGINAANLNGTIASALSSPVLLVADAISAGRGKLPQGQVEADWEALDWEEEVAVAFYEAEKILQGEHCDVVGGLIYKVPRTTRGSKALRERIAHLKIPLAGAIPDDALLTAVQVEDVQRVLQAKLLYDVPNWENARSSLITQNVVATMHAKELMEMLPEDPDPSKGPMVISHYTRPDILLALISLGDSRLPKHVAALVLTGGEPPPRVFDELIKSRVNPVTLPVLLAANGTFDTLQALQKAEAMMQSTSSRKIERAQILFDDYVDMDVLKSILFKERPLRMNPKLFQHILFERAKASQRHVVLPEGEEPRTVQAAGEVLRRGLCHLTLIGDPKKIRDVAQAHHVNLEGARLVNPATSQDLDRYVDILYNLRKKKGLTREQARDQLIQDVNYFGTTMVSAGDADGMVSGAIHTTANTVRPALQVIKTLPGIPLVSSVFFMCLPDKVLVYGDCAINTDPTSEELALIAVASADTAAAFGIEPRVAMLSYATGDSNAGPAIQKVIDATAIAKQKRPDLAIEGPLQYDAAVNPETARTKMKGKETAVAGKATVLIFPDLNTGNNTYKAVQQSTGAVAMGPVLQGLRKPVNDLSRGCTVKDIITTIAITAIQAASLTKDKKPSDASSGGGRS